ncbi:ankyrin repeat domain-containing protein 20B-like [Portunus trituberculatus]|uniref:ankyrin repeat domain-containing protein 20B-like n=1 Tax=Portunus trituberculatus TaxID=210409 RepID=UPI001E1D142F|nr:ankyrin repeat domain-containing protein 20B-like [Portunus trituberculatus]
MTCKAPPPLPSRPPPNTGSLKIIKSPHIFDVHQAIINKNTGEIDRLAHTGLDLGQPIRGTTALSLAVYHGNTEAVKCLLCAGAPVNRRSKDHLDRLETPLISAIRLGHREIFETLVRSGAALDLRDFYNQTPLWFAVKEQRFSFVVHLLKSGAPILFTKATENPLNLAMQFLGYRGRREMVLELIAAGLPLTQEDYKGQNSLYWAYTHGDLPIFTLLIQAGVRLKAFEWLNLTANQSAGKDWRFDEGVSDWLRETLTNPTSLLHQSRRFIRSYLVNMHGRDVRPLLRALTLPPSLPLPPPLLDCLSLRAPLAHAAENPPKVSESRQPPPILL